MEGQQNTQVQYCMRSRWVRNRSKYMIFDTIREGAVEHTNLCANVLFLLFNTPVPASTLRGSLPKWVDWKYLVKLTNGGYALTSKGRSFLTFMETKFEFITDDWMKDLITWRQLPKDCLKDSEGNWLPQAKFIKAIEGMKVHRIGSRRQGSGAGRPALYNHCPICHSSYGLETSECPICRMKAARERMTAIPIPAAPIKSPPVPQGEVCPKCGKMLPPSMFCSDCNVTVWRSG